MAAEHVADRTPLPAIASLNGGAWTTQRLPLPAGYHSASVDDVACQSATWCLAVGTAFGTTATDVRPLAYEWSGTSWTRRAVPLPATASYASLGAVTCWAIGNCLAVGTADPNGTEVPIAERWTGQMWSATVLPTVASDFERVSDVSCTSASACTAVGHTGAGDALIERLNQQGWTASTAATQAGSTQSDLTSVTCFDATSCMAVGDYYVSYDDQGAMADSLTATSSTSQAIPASTGQARVAQPSLACADANWCVAVGSSEAVATLADGSWSTTELAITAAGGEYPQLFGIACPARQACTAGGVASFGGNADEAITETLSTSGWNAARVPDTGVPEAWASAVGCADATHCTALGEYVHDDYANSGYAEVRSGRTWVSTAVARSAFTSISGVSCPSSSWCLAAGIRSASTTQLVAYARRSGRWHSTQLPLPAPIDQLGGLSKPTCPSVGTCFVVLAYTDDQSADRVVVESLTHGSWAAHVLRSLGGAFSQSFNPTLSCATATWCRAVVGSSSTSYSGSALAGYTLSAGRWRARWLSPPANQDERLFANMSCPAVSHCVVVGKSANDASSIWQASVARWDKTTWTEHDLTLPKPAQNESLADVSCSGNATCVAVGTYTPRTGPMELPFDETLDGKRWSPAVLSTSPAMKYGHLTSVSCVAGAAKCQATGIAVQTDGGEHVTAALLAA